MNKKCDRPDLNRRLPDLQSGTLPAELLSLVLRRLGLALQAFWPSRFIQRRQESPSGCHVSASFQFQPSQQAHSILHENK